MATPGAAAKARKGKLATRAVFYRRLMRNGLAATGLIAVSLAAGVIGYHALGGLAWIDAFQNAAMILSGMGPVDPLTSSGAKFFAGCYALYSGLALIATATLALAPILHRLFHSFHLQDSGDAS
jgi:TRAP-type C4-dicarboxylate transport system permease small subunit